MQQHSPQNIYAFEDHLDAVLASCEDLLKLPEQSAEPALLTTSLRVLELSTTMYLLWARQRANDLGRADPRLTNETSRFLARTARLPETAGNSGNLSRGDVFSKLSLTDTPSAHAQDHRCKAAHFGIEAALTGWPEMRELWQTVQNSYLRLAAMEELSVPTHGPH